MLLAIRNNQMLCVDPHDVGPGGLPRLNEEILVQKT
jgi:hypothetical protein